MGEKDNDILYSLTPKFDFLYELGMPTGKKIRYTLIIMAIFLVATIILVMSKGTLKLNEIVVYNHITVESILITVLMIAILFTIIRLIFHIVLQSLQYKNIKYTFCNDYMIYEDSFLNQHRKKIQYANIKEIEIRRTVWDRILGYGIIVIYTNAENEFSNGLVIYSIKEPEKHYEMIDNIIHKSTETKEELNGNKRINKVEDTTENTQTEQSQEDFLESLKNIEK